LRSQLAAIYLNSGFSVKPGLAFISGRTINAQRRNGHGVGNQRQKSWVTTTPVCAELCRFWFSR